MSRRRRGASRPLENRSVDSSPLSPASQPTIRRLLARGRAWVSAPQPVERLAFSRLVLPLAILGFLAARIAHPDHWLSPVGFRVPDLHGDWRQPLYLPPIAPWAARSVAVFIVVAGLCLAAGLFSQPAAAAFALLVAYVTLADRLEAFTVTKLAPVLTLALFLSPCGARYGLDAWRHRRRRSDLPLSTHVPGGVVRFFQVFLAVMYSGAGIAKLRGGWLSENVLWSHLHDSYQTQLSWRLVHSLPGSAWQLLQYATLVFEIGAPLWLALRWTRTAAMVAGLGMHALIGLMFGPVLWFALLMAGLLIGSYAPERWLRCLFRQQRHDGGVTAFPGNMGLEAPSESSAP